MKFIVTILLFSYYVCASQPEFTCPCVSSGIANIVDYGAVGDGVTDCKPAIDSAITSGLPVFIPQGTYFLSAASIQMLPDQIMFGTGNQSILKIKSNTRTIPINNGCEIINLKMIGSGKTGAIYQSGIVIIHAIRWKISHCWFEAFAGNAGANGGGGIECGAIASLNSDGGQIISCYFYNNNCGINFQERSEYINVTGCTFGSNTVGLASGSGNMSFSACTIQGNGTNVKLYSGANNGHSIFTGCNINHGTTKNIDCYGQSSGYTFSGCNIYNGSISIDSSIGIKFIGCDLVGHGYSFTITRSSTVMIADCRFPKSASTALALSIQMGSLLIENNNLDF